ncbi:hypothetical protein EVAR_49925_1 [Eumeta japonica]|uniref:Uncharacterized protein n=1 Tax=Eumeta variegata TaxID=151549 RepID=A0A4C1Y2R0_EUMVA|nr:hypothetical protein EVAR_49925_1 [Eumeta japonica]
MGGLDLLYHTVTEAASAVEFRLPLAVLATREFFITHCNRVSLSVETSTPSEFSRGCLRLSEITSINFQR